MNPTQTMHPKIHDSWDFDWSQIEGRTLLVFEKVYVSSQSSHKWPRRADGLFRKAFDEGNQVIDARAARQCSNGTVATSLPLLTGFAFGPLSPICYANNPVVNRVSRGSVY